MSTHPTPESSSSIDREGVLERDGYRCRLCSRLGEKRGGPATLEVHHSPPNQDIGPAGEQTRITLCRVCHRHHHSLPKLPGIDLESYDLDPAPGDFQVLASLKRIGSASAPEISKEAGISDVYTYERLYTLTAAGVVAPLEEGQWDLADNTSETAVGQLPSDSREAARLARDEMMRRMAEFGLKRQKISQITGVTEQTVVNGINRARAFRPPVPPAGYSPANSVSLDDG